MTSGRYKDTSGTTIGVISDELYTVAFSVQAGSQLRHKQLLFTPSQLERL